MSTSEEPAISAVIADFALNFNLDDAPWEVISHGKRLLLDTFGVAMSCRKTPHSIAVEKTVKSLGSAPQCTLWGSRDKVQLPDAVMYNAALIHGADYDDTHIASIVHPSAPVVSTAVTVGQFMSSSGRDVMEAIIAGWEIIVRLGLAAKGRFHDVGYHGTGLLAPFASACVAAKLMKLPASVLVNALGICGSQSAALQEFLQDGTCVKKLHPGWGAHSAVYALKMAENGFTGPQKVFEGKFGLWQTHIGDTSGLNEAFSNLNTHYHTPEITFKIYPVCHMTHAFIDCMLHIMNERGVSAPDIESIECRIEPRCYHIVCDPRDKKIRPESDYMMRFSLPYVVAIAALKGRVSPWEIDIDLANDPAVQDLMDRVHCVSDESKSNPGHFPGWMELTTKEGISYIKDFRYELGAAQNPIKFSDVSAKFENNLDAYYQPDGKKRIASLIERLDELADISELIESLDITQI
jgi:2-methylcitrate dehydratase PrpD